MNKDIKKDLGKVVKKVLYDKLSNNKCVICGIGYSIDRDTIGQIASVMCRRLYTFVDDAIEKELILRGFAKPKRGQKVDIKTRMRSVKI